MDNNWRACDSLSLPQECGLFHVAFDEMHGSGRVAGKRTCNHESRKSAAGADVHPHARVRRQIQKLERIRYVPRPQLGQRGMCNEAHSLLPRKKKRYEPIKPFCCFT